MLMTGSGMARFSEGNLTKEKMTQKLDQLLLPQALAAARPKMPAVWGAGSRTLHVGPSCRPRAMGICKHALGAQYRFLSHCPWAAAGKARVHRCAWHFPKRGENLELVCGAQLPAS